MRVPIWAEILRILTRNQQPHGLALSPNRLLKCCPDVGSGRLLDRTGKSFLYARAGPEGSAPGPLDGLRSALAVPGFGLVLASSSPDVGVSAYNKIGM